MRYGQRIRYFYTIMNLLGTISQRRSGPLRVFGIIIIILVIVSNEDSRSREEASASAAVALSLAAEASFKGRPAPQRCKSTVASDMRVEGAEIDINITFLSRSFGSDECCQNREVLDWNGTLVTLSNLRQEVSLIA